MEELEKLKEENAQFRETIKQLRKQLEVYRKQTKRRYDLDKDFLPYNEEERE